MTTRGPLMDHQEASVFDVVTGMDFDPHEFSWERPPDFSQGSGPYAGRSFPPDATNSQSLIHDPSDARFTFKLIETSNPAASQRKTHAVRYFPGWEIPNVSHSSLSWDDVLRYLRTWLGVVREVSSTENPWEQLSASQPEGLLPPGAREIPEGEPFSPEEQEAVRQRLDELEQEFRSYRDLTDEQLEALRSEIDALRDELDRMDKWRWARFAVGTSFSLIDLLGLDPAQAAGSVRDLLEFVASLPDQLPPGLS